MPARASGEVRALCSSRGESTQSEFPEPSPHFSESLGWVGVVQGTYLFIALGLGFPLVQAAPRGWAFIYGSDLLGRLWTAGTGYCCDKGAAFTLGSLDNPLKPDTKLDLAVFVFIIVLIYFALNLMSLLICPGEIESYHNNADLWLVNTEFTAGRPTWFSSWVSSCFILWLFFFLQNLLDTYLTCIILCLIEINRLIEI